MNGVVTDHRQFGEQPWNYHTDMITLRNIYFLDDALTNHPGQPFFLEAAPMSPHFHMIDRDHDTLYNECATSGGAREPFGSGNLYGSTLRPAPRYENTIFGDAAHFPVPRPPSFNESNAGKPLWLQHISALTDTDVDCLQKQYWRRMEGMRSVDDMVALFMAYTDYKGVTANTMFVLTSDNGYMKGEHRLTEKLVPYEESIRVPLVIRVPGRTTARHAAQLVLNNDLAPTIADIAGATPTLTMDGRSLMPILLGQNPAWRNAFLVEQYEATLDTSSNGTDFGDLPIPESPNFTLRVMNPPRMYSLYDAFRTGDPLFGQELYDLLADPYELSNVAASSARASEIQQFQNALPAFQSCSGPSCANLEQTFTVTPPVQAPRPRPIPSQ